MARRFFRALDLPRLPPHPLHQPIHRVGQWFNNHIVSWQVAEFVDAEASLEDANTVETVFDVVFIDNSPEIIAFDTTGVT